MSSIYTPGSDLTFDLNVSLQKKWPEPYLKATQNWVDQVQRQKPVEPLTSSSKLGLNTSSSSNSSTSNVSQGELNPATTSYTNNYLTFTAGAVTAWLSGEYSGDYTSISIRQNTTTVLDPVVGAAFSFSVLDQDGNTLATHVGTTYSDAAIDLPEIGEMTITFSAGATSNGATADSDVDATTATDVDPQASFNDSDRNLRPRFENNAQVTAGQFTVNGYDITVNAGDSINAVLNRINTTVPNVWASFADDKVTLTTEDPSDRAISLTGDTSGFLTAVNLSTGGSTIGSVTDDRQVLNQTSQFAGVRSGSFKVNNVSVAVDRTLDTMQSVLDRINNSGAGVQATYDYATDAVTFTSTSGDPISLSEDSTGFLTAIKVPNDDAFAPVDDAPHGTTPRGTLNVESQAAIAHDDRDRQLMLLWSTTNSAPQKVKPSSLTDWDQKPADGWDQKLLEYWQSLCRVKE